jgi:hypothetical protein
MIGFPITFVYLFAELKLVLGQSIKQVNRKMTVYCALISVLILARFVFFFFAWVVLDP